MQLYRTWARVGLAVGALGCGGPIFCCSLAVHFLMHLSGSREVKLFRNVTSSPEGWTQYMTNGTVVENATVRLVCKHGVTSALVFYLRSAFVDNPLLVSIRGSSSPLKDEMLCQVDGSVLIKRVWQTS